MSITVLIKSLAVASCIYAFAIERVAVFQSNALQAKMNNATVCSTRAGCPSFPHVAIVGNHVSGSVLDSKTGITFNDTLAVRTHSEFCQWQEHVHFFCNSDGCSETIWHSKGWSSFQINSERFISRQHVNPHSAFLGDRQITSSNAMVTDFRLSSDLLNRATPMFSRVKIPCGSGMCDYRYLRRQNGGLSVLDFEVGHLMQHCSPGDVRISFETMKEGPMTVVGVLLGERLVPDDIGFAFHGKVNPEAINDRTIGPFIVTICMSRVCIIALIAIVVWPRNE